MWIFDQSKYVAERIENGGDTNPFAHVLNIRAFSCAKGEETFESKRFRNFLDPGQ